MDSRPLSYVSPKAAIRPSSIHGRGLFAAEPIAKAEIVCVKGGYVFPREVLNAMPRCRKVVTGRDWQRSELQERYRGYMSWYLERKIAQR